MVSKNPLDEKFLKEMHLAMFPDRLHIFSSSNPVHIPDVIHAVKSEHSDLPDKILSMKENHLSFRYKP